MPERIQRKRTKGWRMPPDTIYVGRPTKWGNSWEINGDRVDTDGTKQQMTAAECVHAYRQDVYDRSFPQPGPVEIRQELSGKDLACWCPLDQPCHADLLLWIANTDDPVLLAWIESDTVQTGRD